MMPGPLNDYIRFYIPKPAGPELSPGDSGTPAVGVAAGETGAVVGAGAGAVVGDGTGAVVGDG